MNATASPRLRVLMVDDQPIIAEAVRHMLAGHDDIEFRAIHDPGGVLGAALAFDPLLILLDIQMDTVSGLDVLDKIRAHPKLADVSIVMLSSQEEPEVKVDAFRRGANDYVVKLPSALELVARMRYHAGACLAARERETAFRSLLVSQAALAARNAEIEAQRARLEELNRELAESALTDPLTGLRNRRYLRRLLGRENVNAPDPDAPLAKFGTVGVYLFDLDHFKQINDTYGHDAGDAVLVEVGRRLRQKFVDAVALLRWGGEEILVVLPVQSRADAIAGAGRILACLTDAPMQVPGGVALPVRCSLGFAPYPWPGGGGAPSFDVTLGMADCAVYLSKSEGRNRACGCFPGERPVDADEFVEFAHSPAALLAEHGHRVQLERVLGAE